MLACQLTGDPAVGIWDGWNILRDRTCTLGHSAGTGFHLLLDGPQVPAIPQLAMMALVRFRPGGRRARWPDTPRSATAGTIRRQPLALVHFMPVIYSPGPSPASWKTGSRAWTAGSWKPMVVVSTSAGGPHNPGTSATDGKEP